MRRLPPLGAIQAFVHVARLGSLKAAAESLALSSPALTRRIQALEQFVGAPLLERLHNSVTLNPAGQALFADLAPNIDALAAAIDRASAPPKEQRLRLAVASLFGSQRLVPALPALRERNPNIAIDIDTAPHRLDRIDDGIDAAIVIAREIDPKLYSRPLKSEEIAVIGSRQLQDSEQALRHPDDLARTSVLLHRDMPDNFRIWRDTVGLGELEPATTSQYDSGQMILDAAAEGIGVAFMLRSHLESATDERLVQLFNGSVRSPYSYWFVCNQAARSKPVVSAFHDWLFDNIELF